MRALTTVASLIDALNGFVGRLAAWAILPVALIAFAVVLLRYVFSIGYPWLQELYIWLHGAAVLLAAAWVLKEGGHVRVDLFYRRLSGRGRAWVDIVGVLVFLWPMMGFLAWWSLPGVRRSWRLLERSPTADGLEYVYLMKTVIPVFCVMVMLQGLAMLLRALVVLLRRDEA